MTWLERAKLQWESVKDREAVPDEIETKAWDAMRHFVEAQDLRQCYHRQVRVKPGSGQLLNDAAREHRKGVKLFNEVRAWREAKLKPAQ